MANSRKLLHLLLKRRKVNISPTRVIALVFVAIILVGTCLLMLPVSSRSGRSCAFLDALFTATSATCVTGLIPFDTGANWSGFGQAVILCMIELGGLGFMSAASLFIFLLRRKVGLRQRMLMAQALSLNDMEGVVNLQKWVLGGSLSIQAAGALVLMLRFLPNYGWGKAVWYGVFHAVSGFCNAGFDIFGTGNSLLELNTDPVVLITLMVLITVASLGFFVWEELARIRKFRDLSVYTKLVLITTGVLILGGAVLFMILEWDNPGTFGNMAAGEKILNAFFQSVTLRTAGFAAVDQAALTPAGKGVSLILMLVGGSSGSTAGGLKTVTFIVLLLFIWTRARGKNTVTVFRRTIPGDKVMDAMTIAFIMILLAVVGAIVICGTSPVGFTDALFETVSALATVGVTAGVTASLSIPARILIVIFMYFGRVGVLTISLGFLMGNKAEDRIRYANTNLLIG